MNSIKNTGYEASKLLAILIIVPFAGKASMYALLQSGFGNMSEAKKDTYYRFKNRSDIDWDKLLHRFVKRFLKIVVKKAETVKGRRCLVIDDTVLEKRGKKIVGVGKLWEHVTMRPGLGFSILVLGYFDGKSFFPIDFSLHREKGKRVDKLIMLKRTRAKPAALNDDGARQRPMQSESNHKRRSVQPWILRFDLVLPYIWGNINQFEIVSPSFVTGQSKPCHTFVFLYSLSGLHGLLQHHCSKTYGSRF